jgi:hypothetical protein
MTKEIPVPSNGHSLVCEFLESESGSGPLSYSVVFPALLQTEESQDPILCDAAVEKLPLRSPAIVLRHGDALIRAVPRQGTGTLPFGLHILHLHAHTNVSFKNLCYQILPRVRSS